MNEIKNLLNSVNSIKNKYDDLAEYSGENFNVFDILGIYSDELSHSAILGHLLNTKGKHGQKDIFLKLFLKEIENSFDNKNKQKIIKEFNTMNASVIVEKHIDKVNYENEEGGRIDIVINDGKNNIIIENKIWAGDQPQQLKRYYNYDNNAPILYLTLDGKTPSDDSRKDLQDTQDFICVSYSKLIFNWLENSIKEMTNKPIIRETLNQYLVTIKQLTNQSNNNKMNSELLNLIINNEKNFETFKTLLSIKNEPLKFFLKEKFVPFLKEMEEKYSLILNINEEPFINLEQNWGGFNFSNEKLKLNNDLKIQYSFNNGGAGTYNNFIFGFHPKTNDNNLNNQLLEKYKQAFGAYKSSHWLCFKGFAKYEHWLDLEVQQNLIFGDFLTDFEENLKKMVDIVNTTL